MRVVRITQPGGPEVLELATRDAPAPGRGEVRVRVRAAGVNRADLLQRMGRYPPPPGAPEDVPGLEFAGEVDALGAGVHEWAVGDRVMGLSTGGAYSELVVAPAGHLLPIPDDRDFALAAAVPEAFITAYDALTLRARLVAGERVLIHAVGSSVGTAALALAKALGAEVAGTSRTPTKLERARALGLDHAILVRGAYRPEPPFRGWADVICDLVGGSYLEGNLEAVAPLGRIVVLGLMGGRRAALDLGALVSRRATLVGTVLRNRPADEKAQLVARFRRDVLPLLARGDVTPVLDRTFAMTDAAAAHRAMEANANFGALVLAWEADAAAS